MKIPQGRTQCQGRKPCAPTINSALHRFLIGCIFVLLFPSLSLAVTITDTKSGNAPPPTVQQPKSAPLPNPR